MENIVTDHANTARVVFVFFVDRENHSKCKTRIRLARRGKNTIMNPSIEIATMPKSISSDYILAGNPLTDPEELSRLASDIRSTVRLRVAENMNTPDDALMQLASDEDTDVRTAVAENPICPDWLRASLVHDESATVRYAIAEDYFTSFDILEVLSDDENPYVKHAAKRTMAKQEFAYRSAFTDYSVVRQLPLAKNNSSKRSAV